MTRPSDIRLLYAEDDRNLGFITKDRLEEEGFKVTHCPDGEEALAQFKLHHFDACILDIMMPKMDGFGLAREIRKRNPEIPILFLSAKSLKEDRIAGFKTGADDYITKPFSIEELILRIQVFLRRSGNYREESKARPFELGNINFDPKKFCLRHEQGEIALTERENELLLYLSSHLGEVLRREEILRNVWGKDDYFSGRSLDVFISRLRKHLALDPDIMLENIHGVGFRLHLNQETETK
jgi:DNA-binding response OmpR family regulator